jgi:hypothetical protein
MEEGKIYEEEKEHAGHWSNIMPAMRRRRRPGSLCT